MGLLEKLLARLESVEAKLSNLDASVLTGDAATTVAATTDEAAVEAVKPEVPATTAAAQVESQEDHAADVELDSKGVPWDERIHASTKTQNADGSWKKRRGVNDLTVKEVEAELLAANTDTNTGEVTPTPPAPAPVVPSTPTTPTPPAPTVPVTPVAPTTPVAPVADSPRAKVNKEISELTQGFHVPHENIVEYVLKPRGVDTIDALAPDQLEPLAFELGGWADYLNLIADLADKYDEMHSKSPESGLDKVVTVFCQQYGAEFVTPGMVPKHSVSLLYEAVKENCRQWEKHLASQGK